jgi:hypothetical protein
MTAGFRRLGPIVARALALAGMLALVAGCDLLPGGDVAVPRDRGWQRLPLRSFLTRPSLRARALHFCRANVCGYDAAVARFTASGEEGDALVAVLEDPRRLEELVLGSPEPDKVKARVDVQPTALDDWKGVEIEIEGGKKNRSAFGIALVRRQSGDVDAVVVIAAHADLARRSAQEATK